MTSLRPRGPWCPAVLLALLCVASGIGSAGALTDEEIFRGFRVRFITPGARALALGGAFVAIADDATAAQANPAGLHFVTSPDLFVEYRSVDRDTQVLRSSVGSTEIDPVNGFTDLPFLHLEAVSKPDTVGKPTFLGISRPFHLASRRLTVAGSRQVLLSSDRSLEGTQARFAFDTFPNTVVDGEVRAYSLTTPVTGEISTEIIHWNASASFDVHEDFSLGITLTYATLDLEADSLTSVIDPLQVFVDPSHPRLAGQPNSDSHRSRIDDTDSDITYTIGVHWHPGSVFPGRRSPWRLGAVFRKGARFSVRESLTFNDIPDASLDTKIVVPDRFAVGVGYQTPEHWLFSVEYERIEYSDLLDGFQRGVNFLTSSRVADASFLLAPGGSIRYDVNDGGVPRAGAEYTRLLGGRRRRQLRLQAGWFRTPDDRIRMTEFPSADPAVNAAFLDAFPGADEENHFTAGIGFTFGSSSFHIAGETSDEEDQVVGSFTFRLDRGGSGNSPAIRGNRP